MRWSEVIALGAETETKTLGEVKTSVSYRSVYANKKSVKRAEFYQAMAAGLKPELVFEMHRMEYMDETRLKYNGKEYEIIRTYEVGEKIELTVTTWTGSDV